MKRRLLGFRLSMLLVMFAEAFVLSAEQKTAELHGSVLDGNGNAYVCDSCAVRVLGGAREQTLKLDQTGSFRLELEPGIYRVTTEIPNTYPVTRAPIELRSGEVVTLNLVPRLKTLGLETEVTQQGLRTLRHGQGPTNLEQIRVDSESQLVAVIEFEGKKVKPKQVVYTDPTLSYNDLSIYAETVTYDKLRKTFEARGEKVIVDYGGTRRVGTYVKAKFGPQALSLELK